jgi:hypothetical protein
MAGDSQSTYTFLLLIVLGFLIYYLCTPCSGPNKQEEGFANETPKPTLPAFPINSNAVGATAPTASNAQVNTLLSKSEEVVKKDIMNKLASESVKPAVTTPASPKAMAAGTPTPAAASCDSYDPFESKGSASLEAAFSTNIDVKADINAVEMHQKDISNYKASDFLPKETNPNWFDTDFSQAKYNLNDDKLINTERYVIGINTVGQSLKNGSHDLRGTIPNPKFTVSPWNNSTYEPDFNIKSMY